MALWSMWSNEPPPDEDPLCEDCGELATVLVYGKHLCDRCAEDAAQRGPAPTMQEYEAEWASGASEQPPAGPQKALP